MDTRRKGMRVGVYTTLKVHAQNTATYLGKVSAIRNYQWRGLHALISLPQAKFRTKLKKGTCSETSPTSCISFVSDCAEACIGTSPRLSSLLKLNAAGSKATNGNTVRRSHAANADDAAQSTTPFENHFAETALCWSLLHVKHDSGFL